MIDISVVISTFNRREILKKCLECLLQQTYPKDRYEIVVVDDGSRDGTEEMLRAFKLPYALKYFKQTPEKKGAAAANNLGLQNASGNFILFINDDILASPRLIEEHMKFHKKYKNIIVQGLAINTVSLDPPFEKPRGYTGYTGISFGYFTTWNASIKKNLLIEAGLFDEDFREISWEDVELGLRLRKLRIKQKVNRRAIGYHYQPPFALTEFSSLRRKSIAMGHNGVFYYRKHPGLETRLASQAWAFGFPLENFFSLAIRTLGKERIMSILKHLQQNHWHKTLAFLVGLAGYHWYLMGVKEAWHNSPPNPLSY